MTKKKSFLKRRRIRTFFLTLEGKKGKKEEIETFEEDFLREGMVYIQMKLPVEDITEEFEQKLSDKLEQNVIQAKIREANKDDLESLMGLYNKAWLMTNTPFRPITVEDLEAIMEDPDTIFLIAKVYKIDGGFVIIDFEDDYGMIAGLGVLPRFKRKGLGTMLGINAWDYMKKRDIKEVRCEVYRDNTVSYKFISNLGFEVYDTRVYRRNDFY